MRERSAVFGVALIVCCLVATSNPARADGFGNSSHVPFAGLYAGLAVGWGQADVAGVFDSSAFSPLDRVDHEWFDLSGVTGSAYVGYNWRLNSGLVVGVEGDISIMDWSQTLLDGDGRPDDDQASYEINWTASLRGRMGVVIQQSLLYATAGVAWQGAEYEACDEACSLGDRGTVDFSDPGLVVGAGFEHQVSSRFTLRAESLYYYWGDRQDTADLTGDSDPGDFAEVRDAFQVRVGAGYQLW